MTRWIAYWAVGGLVWFAHGQRAPELVNGISVVVNDQVITRDDVLRYVAPSIDLLVRQFGDRPEILNERIRAAERDGLNHLIERKLILHEFDAAGYTLADSIVEEEVQRRIRERFGGDRVALTRTLREEGMTLDAWRQRVREDYIIAAMRNRHVAQSTIISPYRIEKYYVENLDQFRLGNQVRLRTIMISGRNKPDPATPRLLAEEILAQLREGTPFAEVAMIYSEDTYRLQGGDRGWVEESGLRAELAEAAFRLGSGQLSEVIELDGTVWILRVDGVRRDHVRTLPEVRDEIHATLAAQEQDRQHQQWINRLRAKSYVQYY